MTIREADASNPDLTFAWMFEIHVSDRVLMRYRKKLLPPPAEQTLEAHLVLCPVCQLQLGDLPLPELGFTPSSPAREELRSAWFHRR